MKEAVQGSCARHVEQQQEGSASPSRSNLSDMCPVYTPNTPTPPPQKDPFFNPLLHASSYDSAVYKLHLLTDQ